MGDDEKLKHEAVEHFLKLHDYWWNEVLNDRPVAFVADAGMGMTAEPAYREKGLGMWRTQLGSTESFRPKEDVVRELHKARMLPCPTGLQYDPLAWNAALTTAIRAIRVASEEQPSSETTDGHYAAIEVIEKLKRTP